MDDPGDGVCINTVRILAGEGSSSLLLPTVPVPFATAVGWTEAGPSVL